MEPVITGARSTIEFAMEDAEDGDTEGEVVVDEETGLESAVVSLGPGIKKRVSLNTHALQQKNLVSEYLSIFDVFVLIFPFEFPFSLPYLVYKNDL